MTYWPFLLPPLCLLLLALTAQLIWWHARDGAMAALAIEKAMRHVRHVAEFDVIAELAEAEERAMRGGNVVHLYDASGFVRTVTWDGPAMTSVGGSA